jgi:pilus assembly protein CpaF
MNLNERIALAINALPPTDSMTLPSREAQESSEDSQIRKVIAKVCSGKEDQSYSRMEAEYFRAGPLEPLFLDPAITEIIVNGSDSIWYEKHGKLFRLDDQFLSELTYRNFIARLSREGGFQASLDCPFADGKWRGCRVHLIIPPASGDQAVVTLRRHPQDPWTFSELQNRGWAGPEATRLLESLIHSRKNFLIIGCTGSGKTSVLNACLSVLSTSERSLIIEDTDELHVPNAISSKLLTRRDPQGLLKDIDQSDLLRQALRMRPDRIVMGEIRGGEAKDLLMAFATGHSGCMGTLHADSARQALLRLEMLVQLGAPQWSLHAVRTLIWLSLQAVVVVARNDDGSRRLEGIYRIASLEDIGFLIEKTI